MWTRIELKENAKEVLRRTYWMGFAVCLVSGFLAGGISGVSSRQYRSIIEMNNPVIYGMVATFGIVGIIYTIFVGNVISVGEKRYFMSSRERDPLFMDLFSGFSGAQYLNRVKTMFLTSLYLFLWYCLFIIPGIIKSYEYYFVSYIVAENPSISTQRAIELSREMTRGTKFDIFVLELSFIGWNLLGLLLCGVGIFFVAPYSSATFAELYAANRARALTEGFSTTDELCGF